MERSGALCVTSAVDTAELIGQFESESHAQQACTRDYARRAKVPRLDSFELLG